MEPLPVVDLSSPEPSGQPPAHGVGRRTRVSLAILIVLLLLAAGAALARRDTRTPAEVLAAVPAATAEVRTMAMEMHMTIRGPFTIETTAKGIYDLDTGNSRFTMGFGERALEVRTIDGTLYIKAPSENGDRWMASPMPAEAGAGMLQADPTSYLELLSAVSSDIDEVGRERVRGVMTTHYRFEVDPEKLEGSAPQFSAGELAEAGIDTLPLDVWIGPDDLPRRIRMALGAAGSDIEVDMEMYDYGEPVKIEAPPEDQVTRTMSAQDIIREAGAVGAPEA